MKYLHWTLIILALLQCQAAVLRTAETGSEDIDPDGKSATAPPSESMVNITMAEADRANQFMKQSREAMGGGRLQSLRNLKLMGTLTSSGLRADVTTWIRFPHSYRRDVETSLGRVSTVLTRDNAFLYDGSKRIPIPEDQRVAMERRLMRSPLFLLKSLPLEAVPMAAKGRAERDGESYELINAHFRHGLTRIFVDPETKLIRHMEHEAPSGDEFKVAYSDYRDTDGLTYPHEFNAGDETFRVTQLLVEPEFDSLVFEPGTDGGGSPATGSRTADQSESR